MSALFNAARNARNYRLLYRPLHSAQKRLARAEKKSKEKEVKQSQRAAAEVREKRHFVDRTLEMLRCVCGGAAPCFVHSVDLYMLCIRFLY